jgi:hypothetical protein
VSSNLTLSAKLRRFTILKPDKCDTPLVDLQWRGKHGTEMHLRATQVHYRGDRHRKRNKDGSTSYIAQVRCAGFKLAAKSFPKRCDAEGWAEQLEASLRAQRTRGVVRHDVATLTVDKLLLDFLVDPETTALRTFDDQYRLCAWWIQEFGRVRCVEFNVLRVREARDKLQVEAILT